MSTSNENLKFEITLSIRGNFTIIEKATGDSLVESLSKFLFVVRNVQEKLSGEEYAAKLKNSNMPDDDIPF